MSESGAVKYRKDTINTNNSILAQNKLVTVVNDEEVTDTLTVARAFNKQHKNVLQLVDNKLHSAELSAQLKNMFTEFTYQDTSGKNNKAYQMNRDGFIFLVTSFRGTKVDLVKLAFIEAFKYYEQLAKAPEKKQLANDVELHLIGTLNFNGQNVRVLKGDGDTIYYLFADFTKAVGYSSNSNVNWGRHGGVLHARVSELTEVGNHFNVISLERLSNILPKLKRDTRQRRLIFKFYDQEQGKTLYGKQDPRETKAYKQDVSKILKLIELAKVNGNTKIIPDLIAEAEQSI